MAKTSDNGLIKSFVIEYLIGISEGLDQCNAKLITQSRRCPPTFSIQMIDIRLKDLVCVHQRRFTKNLKYRIIKFKASIRDNELWQQLSSHRLSIDQVKI